MEKKKKKGKTMRPECGLIVDSRILGLNLGSAVQPWASGLTSLGICCTHLFKGRGKDQVSEDTCTCPTDENSHDS